jgi:hypothetical protein
MIHHNLRFTQNTMVSCEAGKAIGAPARDNVGVTAFTLASIDLSQDFAIVPVAQLCAKFGGFSKPYTTCFSCHTEN